MPKTRIKKTAAKKTAAKKTTASAGGYAPPPPTIASPPVSKPYTPVFAFNNVNEPCVSPLHRMDKAPLEPRIIYSTEAWAKISHILRTSPIEIAWLGFLEELRNLEMRHLTLAGYRVFMLWDVYVPQQEVGPASADIDAIGMSDAANWMLEHERYVSGCTLNYWGHSHVNMATYPSGTDDRTTDEMLSAVGDEVFVRGIYNKKGEAKLDCFDIPNNCVFHNIEHGLMPASIGLSGERQLDDEIRTRVRRSAPVITRYPNGRDLRSTAPLDFGNWSLGGAKTIEEELTFFDNEDVPLTDWDKNYGK